MNNYSSIVVGGGVYGNLVALALAERDERVLQLVDPASNRARSSVADSRIWRLVTIEDRQLLALSMRSGRFWKDLSKSTVLRHCSISIVDSSPRNNGGARHHGVSNVVRSAIEMCERNGIAHSHELTPVDLQFYHRVLAATRDSARVFSSDEAMVLDPLEIDRVLRKRIRAHKSIERVSERVVRVDTRVGASAVTTSLGNTHAARRVVLCRGRGEANDALMQGLVLQPQTSLVFKFRERCVPSVPPGVLVHIEESGLLEYFVPYAKGNRWYLKYGLEQQTHSTSTPALVAPIQLQVRSMALAQIERVRNWFPDLDTDDPEIQDCVYTLTQSGLPEVVSHGDCLVVAACSGHGFKYAPALAESIADRVVGKAGSAAEVA